METSDTPRLNIFDAADIVAKRMPGYARGISDPFNALRVKQGNCLALALVAFSLIDHSYSPGIVKSSALMPDKASRVHYSAYCIGLGRVIFIDKIWEIETYLPESVAQHTEGALTGDIRTRHGDSVSTTEGFLIDALSAPLKISEGIMDDGTYLRTEPIVPEGVLIEVTNPEFATPSFDELYRLALAN